VIDAILDACTAGDLEEVTRLLDEDTSLVNARSMMGVTPMHAAWYAGRADIIQLLRLRGVEMDVFLASELGDVGSVRLGLALVNEFNASGSTALHGACYWGQVEIARLLLESGADANVPTRDGFLNIRPLGCAVATPDIPNPSQDEMVVVELVDLLLANGANVNGRRRDGLTALHSAAFRNHLRVIEVLLQHGADPAIKGSGGEHAGQTGRDIALAQGHAKAADWLGWSVHLRS
jgi:ankyrin repeat protein